MMMMMMVDDDDDGGRWCTEYASLEQHGYFVLFLLFQSVKTAQISFKMQRVYIGTGNPDLADSVCKYWYYVVQMYIGTVGPIGPV